MIERTYEAGTTDYNEPPFWRGVLESTVSYLKWGYGALLLSFIGYGLYVLAKSPTGRWLLLVNLLPVILAVIVVSALTLWRFSQLIRWLVVSALILWRFSQLIRGRIHRIDPMQNAIQNDTAFSELDIRELVELLQSLRPQERGKPLGTELRVILATLRVLVKLDQQSHHPRTSE